MGSEPAGPVRIEVDPAVDQLISRGARYLEITEKDLVAEAVRHYLKVRLAESHAQMTETLNVLAHAVESYTDQLANPSPEDTAGRPG